MRTLTRTLPLLALLAACGGDGTGPDAGPDAARGLNSTEVNAISRALLSPGVGVARDGASRANQSVSGGDGVSALQTGSIPFAFTVPCQPSGSTAVSGSVSAAWDFVAQVAAVHAEASLRPQACTVQNEGSVVTVTGDPSIVLTLTAAGDATGLKAVLLTESGALNWTRSDGASGRCAVQVAALLLAGTPNYHVTGTVCGTRVDFTGPL
jgi:hypothetical protein